ncbi:hypothetical protein LCGC14_0390280 [marine sediment metagenome]|uniref:Uncharacterized protein n=1 Tax=marine sediment metagenome TaxID=412755 RepID=A0A0F9VLZ2_9ZZZZ
MRKDELQYLSDTILIEQLASDPELLKQAGLFEDIGFGSIAETVKQFAKEHISADAPGGYAGSIVSLMAPAILWRIHPILGIAGAAAYALGFDIVTIVKGILGSVSGKIDSGEGVDLSEISSLGKGAVSGEIGDVSEADDMLLPIREAFEVNAQRRRKPFGRLPQTPWGREKGAPLLRRIFGTLSRSRGKWLVGGIIIWFLKTLLVGAGLVAGAGLVKSLISPKKAPETAPVAPVAPAETTVPTHAPAPKEVQRPDPFVPSGSGKKDFANDANNIWIVPLINRSIDDTLAIWAVDVYPELKGREFDIQMSPAFSATVSRLKRNFSARQPGSLIMPIGLHNRKQVVDLFSRDVKKH